MTNAMPGVYEGGEAVWAPHTAAPSIDLPSELLPALPAPSAVAQTVARVVRAVAAPQKLADRSFAQIMAEREHNLRLIATGTNVTRYAVIFVLGLAIVVVVWVVLVQFRRARDETDRDDD